MSDWANNLLKTVKTEINYELSLDLMKDLSGKTDMSELMAIVRMRNDDYKNLSFSDNPLIAVFDRPPNKGNLGTIIRSCDSLGVEALIITGHAVDLYDPDVIISTMGSFFNIPVIRISDNNTFFEFSENLKNRYEGFKVIGTTAHKEKPIYKENLTNPTMIMLGNETDGLCRAFKEYCDTLVSIPMVENSFATSFNVACAGSIMMYEITRQRSMQE